MTRIGCDSANCKRTNLVPPCNSERVKINFTRVISGIPLSPCTTATSPEKRAVFLHSSVNYRQPWPIKASFVVIIPNLQIIDYFIFIFIHFPSSSIFKVHLLFDFQPHFASLASLGPDDLPTSEELYFALTFPYPLGLPGGVMSIAPHKRSDYGTLKWTLTRCAQLKAASMLTFKVRRSAWCEMEPMNIGLCFSKFVFF